MNRLLTFLLLCTAVLAAAADAPLRIYLRLSLIQI